MIDQANINDNQELDQVEFKIKFKILKETNELDNEALNMLEECIYINNKSISLNEFKL